MKKTILSSAFLLVLSMLTTQTALASDCPVKFAGAITIHGTAGNDKFIKGESSNLLTHYINDVVVNSYTLDRRKNYIIKTGNGNDEIHYYGGNLNIKHMQFCTGSGRDDIRYSVPLNSTNFWIYAGSGNDLVRGYANKVYIYGGAGNDEIRTWGSNLISANGEDGNDCITSDNPNASLNGLAGNDVLIAERTSSPQESTLNGSGGSDTCVYPHPSYVVLYSCDTKIPTPIPRNCEYYGWNP